MGFVDICNVSQLERLAEEIVKIDESFDHNKWFKRSRREQRALIKRFVSRNYQDINWEYVKMGC